MHDVQNGKHVICLEMCYLRSQSAEQVVNYTGADRIYFGDTGAFYFDNISAGDVKLFPLKHTLYAWHANNFCSFLRLWAFFAWHSKPTSHCRRSTFLTL